jgi:hypothetical protein
VWFGRALPMLRSNVLLPPTLCFCFPLQLPFAYMSLLIDTVSYWSTHSPTLVPYLTMTLVKVKVTLRLTVSHYVTWYRTPSGAHDQIIITCVTVTVLFLWGTLSDERTGLSFLCAAGHCQRSLSLVLVPWDLRPSFTVSDLSLPFSSPPMIRRVTVEVFDPASTRVCPTTVCPLLTIHVTFHEVSSSLTE